MFKPSRPTYTWLLPICPRLSLSLVMIASVVSQALQQRPYFLAGKLKLLMAVNALSNVISHCFLIYSTYLSWFGPTLFPSYPWWLMPFYLPGMSRRNPLFKDHFVVRLQEITPNQYLWKWSIVWRGTALSSFSFWDTNVHTSCIVVLSLFFNSPTEF